MFYRLNLLITRCIYLCCIAENINVNENIFVEKLYSNYLYLYICESIISITSVPLKSGRVIN